ncbi:MAG: alpha/beta hydrolase [Alphaproteobacteria bacterium]|nr:alpha/beta hydrolase [Alphaproteobacteria bacterium]
MIGQKTYGTGLNKVLVMHDWFCDSTSYDALIPFLDTTLFTYVFMDLRGYGKSKSIQGECSVEEAAGDAIALVNHLKWDQFHVVGHSMSGMIAQRIALEAEDRVKSVIAITPVPACGSPVPEEVLAFLKDAAVSNDQSAGQIIGFMTSGKLPMRFVDYKVKEWRTTSLPEARAAYLHMFSETNFADQVKGLKTPFLVIAGGNDAEGYSESVMKETFLKWYPNAELAMIANSGHYPMQETPLYLLNLIEGFLGRHMEK